MAVHASRIVLLATVALLVAGCPISQEIIVEFPLNANWSFEYYDALGEYLGFGKAVVEFNEEDGSFKMTITENAFGDQAIIVGDIWRRKATAQSIPFRATGTWFTGEEFRFEGAFDGQLQGILHCSVAYARPIRWRVRRLNYDPQRCTIDWLDGDEEVAAADRKALIRENAEEYLENLFLWKALRTVQAPAEPGTGLKE